MEIILVLHIGFLLSLAIASPSRPCGCKPDFDFCANDYHTYHSVCEYKCRHPSTPFHDWYILYQGPCLAKPDSSETTTKRNSHGTSPDYKCGAKVQGYKWEPRTGSCYKFHQVAENWHAARAYCQNEGADLAVINSNTESAVLSEIFRKYPTHKIFGDENGTFAVIGFKKSADDWVTINGDSLAEAGFETWSPGEPNNANGVMENCGSIDRNGLFNDCPCYGYKYAYICEIPL